MLPHPQNQLLEARPSRPDLTDEDNDTSSLSSHSVGDDVAADTEPIDKELEWATRKPRYTPAFPRLLVRTPL